MDEHTFYVDSSAAASGLAASLCALFPTPPVFLCIGSDAVIGDSLSPLVGSLLKEFYRLPFYIYGDLAHTVTARELPFYAQSLKSLHPNRPILAIDASVGDEGEIGMLKLRTGGLLPGKGVGKTLSPVGDYSLLGVVSARGKEAFRHLEVTRLGLVYRMAGAIAAAINGAFAARRIPSAPLS